MGMAKRTQKDLLKYFQPRRINRQFIILCQNLKYIQNLQRLISDQGMIGILKLKLSLRYPRTLSNEIPVRLIGMQTVNTKLNLLGLIIYRLSLCLKSSKSLIKLLGMTQAQGKAVEMSFTLIKMK
jgi:hypothetical protein